MNTTVTKDFAENLQPDAIIAALGARPIVPTFIKGYQLPNVYSAEEVYYDMSKAGNDVVLIGGGLVGCELGIHLAMTGKNVTIVEMMPSLNFGDNQLHGRAIGIQIEKYGINVILNTKVKEIQETGIVAEGQNGECFLKANMVIYAMDQTPLREEVNELRLCAPEFYAIGDCTVPANIYQATNSAYYAARNIGRV